MSINGFKIIGRKDKIDFPQLGLFDIEAKIDTGAYSSALHCDSIIPFERNGVTLVKFHIYELGFLEKGELNKEFTLPVYGMKNIRSSCGNLTRRYLVKTPIVLFKFTYRTVFSLCSREEMKYPVLLGRRLLLNNFIVDVSQADLSFRQKN